MKGGSSVGREKRRKKGEGRKEEWKLLRKLTIFISDSSSRKEISSRRIFRERPIDKFAVEKDNLVSKLESLKPKHKKYASLTNIQKLKQKYMATNYGGTIYFYSALFH